MSASDPTKTCPRCHAQLPIPAAFCGFCGWQFSAPAEAAPAPAVALGQSAFGTGPQSQPVAPALAPVQPQQPTLSGPPLPGQPGAAGYAPVAAVSLPRQGLSRTLLAVIVLAAVLTVAIPGFFVFGGHGSSLFTDRHGLPSNVPLPDGATFHFMDKDGTSATSGDWYWTVGSPTTSDTLRTFYQSNLTSNGWTILRTLGSVGDYEFQACQSTQDLDVEMDSTITVLAPQGSDPQMLAGPAGGAALRVSLASGPCS